MSNFFLVFNSSYLVLSKSLIYVSDVSFISAVIFLHLFSALFCLLDIFNFFEHCSMWQGAVENVLERSSSVQLLDGSVVELNQRSRDLILKSLNEMSTKALRCLGFAYKDDLLDFATYNGD